MTANEQDIEDEYAKWRESQGYPPLAPTRRADPKKPHTFHLSDTAWKGLQRLALQHEYARGLMGANVTQFLETLGYGLILPLDPNTQVYDKPSYSTKEKESTS